MSADARMQSFYSEEFAQAQTPNTTPKANANPLPTDLSVTTTNDSNTVDNTSHSLPETPSKGRKRTKSEKRKVGENGEVEDEEEEDETMGERRASGGDDDGEDAGSEGEL